MYRHQLSVTIAALGDGIYGRRACGGCVAPEPDYQDQQVMVHELTAADGSPTPPSATGAHANDYLSPLAKEQAAAGNEGTGFSNYPGGAGGTSNGEQSAAELGEIVGARVTSGGSMSPFALASER